MRHEQRMPNRKMKPDLEIRTASNAKFLPYNTGNEPLPLPEYGRSIQQMVDYCVMIPDREERTACAYTIVDVMRTLFPKALTDKKDDSKFWDHLNIMARFELDIDFPCPVTGPEDFNIKPDKIPYTTGRISLRHYGKAVEQMIDKAKDMPEGAERDEVISLIANQMKKLLHARSPESADDRRVFHDLERMSDGKIILNEEHDRMPDYVDFDDPQKQKGKKKKQQ